MKIATPAILALVMFLMPGTLHAAESAVPFRSISFDAATKAAAAEGKLVFIDFYTTWCGPCKELDARTWTDADVGKLLAEKTVPLKIDAEQQRDLATRYKVAAYPTLLLLKPDGTEVDRLIGFRDAGRFVRELTSAIEGKNSIARATDAVATAATGREGVRARYDLGKSLAQSGQFAEALNEYLWCFDEGMIKEGSFTGVRLSFLLSDIMRLSGSFPLARDALVERRDAAERRMLDDVGDRRAAADFSALCGALGDEKRMLDVFDRLPAGDARRGSMGHRVYRLLVSRQRYNDALAITPYSQMVDRFNRLRALPARSDARMVEANRRLVVNSTLENIEVLVGAGEREKARELIGMLLEFDASGATQDELHARLKRAGEADFLAEPGPAKP